jgi:hypothetical protein
MIKKMTPITQKYASTRENILKSIMRNTSKIQTKLKLPFIDGNMETDPHLTKF